MDALRPSELRADALRNDLEQGPRAGSATDRPTGPEAARPTTTDLGLSNLSAAG